MSEPSKEALEAAAHYLVARVAGNVCDVDDQHGNIWDEGDMRALALLLEEWREKGPIQDLAMMLRLIARGRTYTPEEITDFLKRHGCTGNPLRYKPPN